MKVNHKRLLSLLLSGCFISFGLSACIPAPPKELCDFGVAVPPTENSKQGAVLVMQVSSDFPDSGNAISQNETLKASFPSEESGSPFLLGAVVADGNPSLVYQEWVSLESGDTQEDLQRSAKRTQEAFTNVYPCLFLSESPFGKLDKDVDLVAALQVASDSLNGVAGEKKIIVFSNGLQTSGAPNFSLSFPASDEEADELIARLEDEGALPNLKGVKIFWTGLGQVTEGQTKIEQKTRNILQHFWTQLIEKSGGIAPETFDSGALPGQALAGAPDSSPPAEMAKVCLFTVGVKSGFAFKPDSTEFVSLNFARQGAESIALDIEKAGCGGESLKVTGYTASGKSKDAFEASGPDFELSKGRAEAFAKLLREYGMSVTSVVGGGKGPENDWDANGTFVEELGQLNRIVKIESDN